MNTLGEQGAHCSIGAAGGLMGGGTTGNVALSLPTVCAMGQLLKWNGATWGCAADLDTNSGGTVTSSTTLSPGTPFIVVEVADTGAGIAPEVADHLFDRFAKSGESRGSGLGLAIARHLVEAHGGTIEASSGPDRGTTIRFTLPIDGGGAS